ncbi:MAG: ArsR family transcriptional regulator [Nitrosomonadales bacterium]|nr:MAG: ArsR family transcriptional regulator [Nitrosomonadales bacterium]
MTPYLRRAILATIAEDGSNVAARLAGQHGVSRQSASVWLGKLKQEGVVASSGVGRGVRYRLATLAQVRQVYPRAELHEDRVWSEAIAPALRDLPANVRDIWRYAVTEMVNNAIDHSGSEQVTVELQRDALNTTVYVADEGEGIFLKIQRALNLYDPREAILELAKGKLTTDPARHTGEGIFFSSKVMDAFDIHSGKLHFMHDEWGADVLLERPADASGTLVLMRLANDGGRTLQEVFDQFAAPEEYTFAKTIVPVRLAQHEGEKLVSRSQAKRLTMRFERFQTVVLDFDGVEEIGQAFADEVFRVFQQAHPATALLPIHMTPAVENMFKRAMRA